MHVAAPGFTARYLAGPAAEFAAHSHSGYTITAILEGSGSMTVGASIVAIERGVVALTNPGQMHSAQASNFALVSLSLGAELVEEQLVEMGLYQAGVLVAFRSDRTSDQAIVDLADLIAEELQAERVGRQAMIEHLVGQLTIHLARTHLTVRRAAGIELSRAGPVDRRLRRAVELMHDNYERDLPLAEIARAAYLSESHFSHLFKEITGLTVHAYLANLRIEQARGLLLSTDLPIGDVASRVGFRSQSHFARAFKAVAGVAPRQYREGPRAPR